MFISINYENSATTHEMLIEMDDVNLKRSNKCSEPSLSFHSGLSLMRFEWALTAVAPEAADSDGNGGGSGGGVATARPLFKRSQTSTFLRNSGEMLVSSWPGCASDAISVAVAAVAVTVAVAAGVVAVLLLLPCSDTSVAFFRRWTEQSRGVLSATPDDSSLGSFSTSSSIPIQ